MANRTNPPTKHQKGRRWATATLVICGAFSIYANVRSGVIDMEPIVVSVFPPVVAFLTSHLITYFSPRTFWTKTVIYGGFGLITTFAMIGSGKHIVDTALRAGQPLWISIIYVAITDAPMLFAAGILIEKVPTGRNTTVGANRTQPAKKTIPPKKTTAPKATTTTKKPTVPKQSKTQESVEAARFSNILDDPLERDMLNV